VVAGGPTRRRSVAAALEAVPDQFDIVLVHDAARALAPPELVGAVADAVRAGHDAVIPVLPVIDTIKEVSASAEVLGTVDRSVLRAVQTPQGFRRAVLVRAHAAAASGASTWAGADQSRFADDASDDAGLVERLGLGVACVPGSDHAIKITRPIDLAVAELLLSSG
jgi:2-C-methyl-D-erythritol 4-phosphate cytidylyltransferase